MIFFPKPAPPENARKLAGLEVEVRAADGAMLRGWEIPADDAAPQTDCRAAVYFGGNNEELSAPAVDNGGRFSCPHWYVNYRGFGESEGEPSERAMRSDALLVFDAAVKKLNIAAEDACVIGRSLGSHMAAHVAANRPVKKLVMVTPFDSALNVAKRRYPVFPIKLLMRHPFNTLAEAPQISAPVLFLLADSDNVVPHPHTENLMARWPEESEQTSLLLPDTTHGDITDSPHYWRAVADFMKPE